MIKDKFRYQNPDYDFVDYPSWSLKTNPDWHVKVTGNSFVPVEFTAHDLVEHKSHSTLLDAMVYVLVSECVNEVNRREALAMEGASNGRI